MIGGILWLVMTLDIVAYVFWHAGAQDRSQYGTWSYWGYHFGASGVKIWWERDLSSSRATARISRLQYLHLLSLYHKMRRMKQYTRSMKQNGVRCIAVMAWFFDEHIEAHEYNSACCCFCVWWSPMATIAIEVWHCALPILIRSYKQINSVEECSTR